MGRFQSRRRKNNRKNKEGDGKQNTERRDSVARVDGKDYVQFVTDQGNYKMEAYYAAQGLHSTKWDGDSLVPCTTLDDFDQERLRWREAATKSLPASFRIARDIPEALRGKVQSELDELLSKVDNHSQVILTLGFLPHAYQLHVDRSTIRKDPNLNQFHEWMKQQTSAGFITRQETVSMVPPVLLATQPTDCVLDMCAAPGSKTTQILECLNGKGSLIANDNNPKRAHMLVTQMKRIMHMNPVSLITCCDGQFFPSKAMQFDRILCDVPCTGDGTSRKNIDVWKVWKQNAAMNIHNMQLQIAWKGAAHLLKVGGTMCYSTCSVNPVENEAVVAELLRRSKGALELVEVSLEGFRVRPGWSTWKVLCEELTERQKSNMRRKNNDKMRTRRKEWEVKDDNQADAGDAAVCENDEKEEVAANVEGETVAVGSAAEKPERYQPQSTDQEHLLRLAIESGLMHFSNYNEVPEKLKFRIRSTAFPPSAEEVESLHLNRCVRCLPHDNDTGAFFVAVIRKVGPLSTADRKSTFLEPDAKRARLDDDDGDVDLELEENEVVKSNCVRDENGQDIADLGREDFVPVSDSVLDELVEFFGLDPKTFERDLIMTRASGESKILYYIARSVKDMIDRGIQKRVTVIHSGLKAFTRSSLDGSQIYRICQDAVHFLSPHLTKRKIVVGVEDFERCLGGDRFVNIEDFTDSVSKQVLALSLGSFVFILEGYEDLLNEKMIIVLWRCRTERVEKLVSQVERDAIVTKIRALQGTLLPPI